MFQVTMVHELTHAWTEELGIWPKGAEKTMKPLIEGFCEYVALCFIDDYLLADGPGRKDPATRDLATRIATRMKGNDDVNYGAGLRDVLKNVTEATPVAWLRKKAV